MKVLLTGATGFLGRHLIAKLTEEGCDIVTIVRPTSETDHLKKDRLQLFYGDLRDEELIREALEDVVVVIHAATSKGGAWQDYHDVNIRSTELLLKHCRGNKFKRFVFLSSVIVYDHSSVADRTVFSEETPFEKNILTNYSKSKIEAEDLVRTYHEKYGVPTVVLRPAGLFGPGGLIYPARLGFSAGADRYVVVGNGRKPLPLSHVRSVTEAVWKCVETEGCVGQSYNIVEDDPITQLDYLGIVREVLKPELSIVRIPLPVFQGLEYGTARLLKLVKRKSPVRPLYLKLCSSTFHYANDKAKQELGWQPVNKVENSIREMMQWHKERRTDKRNALISKLDRSVNSDRVYNVGLVGCGMFAETHLSILGKFKQADVVAVCDPDEITRKNVSEKFGIPNHYASLEEMLKHEKIEAVHIVTPAQNHAESAITAMNHGCHVLVEKPMALNAFRARRMAEVAEKNNVKLCVDHNHLYDDVMMKTRELIARGVLGRIAHVETWYGTSYSSNSDNRYLRYEARNHWVYQLPGSLYQNMISHPISLLLDVMEDVSEVKASAKYQKIVPHMKNDELRVMLGNDRMLGTLTLSLGVSPRYNLLNIYGTNATLRVDFLNKYLFLDKVVPMAPKVISRNMMNFKHAMTLVGSTFRNGFNIVRGKYSLFEGNEKLIPMFYHSIILDEPVPVSMAEGVRSMEIMDEIWKQINSDNVVSSMENISGENRCGLTLVS